MFLYSTDWKTVFRLDLPRCDWLLGWKTSKYHF